MWSCDVTYGVSLGSLASTHGSAIRPRIHSSLVLSLCRRSRLGAVALPFNPKANWIFKNEDTPQLFDEMLTVDTMLELIRPLSEGLALFAEYDIAPGSSCVITTPLQWTSIALSERSKLLDLAQPQAAQELTERL